jgi:hypothetical protein
MSRVRKGDIWGCAVLLVSGGTYTAWLAPGQFSPASAELFLAEVRTWKHVGLHHYGLVSWAIGLGLSATAVFASSRWQASNDVAGMLRRAILLAVPAALALALLALYVDSVRLVQFQPIRIFLWIHFLSLILIALNVVPAFRHDRLEGTLLLVILVLLTARTGWVVPALAATLAYYAVLSVKRSPSLKPTLISFPVAIPSSRLGVVASALILAASIVAAANPAIADDGEHGADWDRVRNWIRQETPRTEKFLTTTTGADFSVRALRSSVSSGGGALAWVDPVMFQQSRARVDQVRNARAAGVWNLEALGALARNWGASYLLVKGPFTPQDAQPLCRFGVYTVFFVGPASVCCEVL